jgi:hypothetical protein
VRQIAARSSPVRMGVIGVISVMIFGISQHG